MGAAAGEGPAAGPGAGAGGLCPGRARRGRRSGRQGGTPGQALPCRPVPGHPQEGKPDKSSPYIQVLEEDWRQALRDQQEQANTIFSLRKDLRRGEALRARVHDQDGCTWGPGPQPGCPHSAWNGAAQLSAPLPYFTPSWRHRGPSLSPQSLPALPQGGQGRLLVWRPGLVGL